MKARELGPVARDRMHREAPEMYEALRAVAGFLAQRSRPDRRDIQAERLGDRIQDILREVRGTDEGA